MASQQRLSSQESIVRLAAEEDKHLFREVFQDINAIDDVFGPQTTFTVDHMPMSLPPNQIITYPSDGQPIDSAANEPDIVMNYLNGQLTTTTDNSTQAMDPLDDDYIDIIRQIMSPHNTWAEDNIFNHNYGQPSQHQAMKAYPPAMATSTPQPKPVVYKKPSIPTEQPKRMLTIAPKPVPIHSSDPQTYAPVSVNTALVQQRPPIYWYPRPNGESALLGSLLDDNRQPLRPEPSVEPIGRNYGRQSLIDAELIAAADNSDELQAIADCEKRSIEFVSSAPSRGGRAKSHRPALSYAERQLERRLRNREAAKKCRQKKLDKIAALEEEKRRLTVENREHENILDVWRKQIIDYKMQLILHQMSPNKCSLYLPHHY